MEVMLPVHNCKKTSVSPLVAWLLFWREWTRRLPTFVTFGSRARAGAVLVTALILLGQDRAKAGSVTGINVGSQSGTLTYGTAGSATFTISFTSGGSGSYSGLAASGLPAGATYSLSATSG